MAKRRNKDEITQPLRYVLYARKSSEENDAQLKSLPDQIKYCKDYAARNGLRIAAIVQEAQSAKTPATFNGEKPPIRPKFVQMVNDIKAGKYDGIISYHPDRLARNSLDSGILIEMLDHQLRDMKFFTVQFTNDASGKLLLNVLFAMSKEYSEHLSENVQRGVDTNFEQGKSAGVHKWGYIRSEITGFYEPDPACFDHIKKGWAMILEGKTQKEVVDYWTENDVHRYTKITRKNKSQRKITISAQMASTIFRDPIYYGILCQTEQQVDLRLVTPNFKPMITEDEYNAVQEMSQYRAKRHKNITKRATFYPLRQFVSCSECGEKMQVGKSRGSGGDYYLYYRCDNKNCTRATKNVRAKVIFDDMYGRLDKLRFTAKDYDLYAKEIDRYTGERAEDLRIEINSKKGRLKHLQKELDANARRFAGLPENTMQVVRDTMESDMGEQQDTIVDLKGEVEELSKKLVDPEKIKMTKEDFLNLANSVADKMRAGTPVEKDILCRILFLNIVLDNKNAPSYIWNEPFATLMKSRKINSGAPD